MKLGRTVVLSLVLLLQCGFLPFTKVKDVCPACAKSKRDVVVFLSGVRVNCTVVAQNVDYYVVERLGEYRVVAKSNISAVDWRKKKGAELAAGDQVITAGGIVFHGRIVEEVRGRYFVVQSGHLRHIVWVAQIKAVYKAGKVYPFARAAAP